MSVNLLEALFTAYYDARKNKRSTKSQLRFEIDLEHNLSQLYEDIRTRRYVPSPCMCFITESPVKREIFASPFRDRVVHHLLYNYISPLFERQFIFDSYSCRKEKGTLVALKRYVHHIRSCSDNYKHSCYILKLDLKGYFMSIDKNILYGLVINTLRKKMNTRSFSGRPWREEMDMELVEYLIETILLRDPTKDVLIVGRPHDWKGLPESKSLFGKPLGVGLPIGDLTSQLFSNVYLNELDQYCKRMLKCRHYGRYVDDFYIIDRAPQRLKAMIPLIEDFLRERLNVTLHPDKISLTHITKGTAFMGAYVRPHCLMPGKRLVYKFRQAVRQVIHEIEHTEGTKEQRMAARARLNSYLGLLCHYRSFHLRKSELNIPLLYRWFCFDGGFRKAIMKAC